MSEVGVIASFAAGILALLSPCSALLLPSFFAYAFTTRRALVARTLVFYLGLVVTLVPLGTGASAASSLFYGHRPLLIAVAGWTVVGLGVLQVFGRGFAIPGAQRLQTAVSARSNGGWLSTFFLGAVYGLAGFCSGPVLGAILTVAATQESPVEGGALLAVYALGMAAPLLVLAALWDRFDLGSRRWLRGRTLSLGAVRLHTTSLLAGLLFIAVGVVFLRYDGTAGLTGSLGLGDLTDLEYSAQQAVTEWAAAVPAWAVPLVVALAAAAVAWRRRASRSSHVAPELERVTTRPE
ncbi:cytochrome c biogenesis CcdA family protein [Nocardioides sp. SOB77]|uniref:Cytochrome c biogenesis CcdA family protein n=1 Tax=Nocardioides oceani TaxID=3058369 RepID=A0ABT8FM21_9ACTN|nr:cytochrome c biogenesis CcdA family protein [Nocardioides oceani]MDN4175212.1 cytochrome c biogenesis CcdA family protein [Nocardioides oceani]